MRVAGIDLSLAKTGYAIWDSAWRAPYVDRILTEAEPRNVGLEWRRKRLRSIADGLQHDLIDRPPLDLAVLEQPAYSSMGGSQHDRSGLHWFVLDFLIFNGVPVVEIGPGTLKLYITNNGRAEKPEVVRAIRLAFPDVHITDDNEADALGLCAMGARHLGHPIEAGARELSTKQAKSWAEIKWPERTSTR